MSHPRYTGSALVCLQAPAECVWTPMVPQGVVEIPLHFHFKALLSPIGSFRFYNLKNRMERGGERYAVLVFWSP